MKTGLDSGKTWPWLLGILSLFGLAFSIACFAVPFTPSNRAIEDPMLDAFFGSTRKILGRQFYYEADVFFHQGVGYYKKKAFTNDIFQSISGKLSPHEHLHLTGQRVREIMPWLYFTLKADPYNLEAIGVTAFWLTTELNRPDLAEQILQEAQKDNPRSYSIRQEKGRLYIKTANHDRAAMEFDTGLRLARSAPEWTNDQFRIDMAEMLMYRGLLHETRGNTNQAIADYRDILQLFPGRKELQTRVDALAHGEQVESAAAALNSLSASRTHVCEREEDEHGHTHTHKHEFHIDADHDAAADNGD